MQRIGARVVVSGGTGFAALRTMNVDIALFAYLADYQPDGLGGRSPRAFTLAEGTTIADVIASLGLPDEPRIVFANGKHAEEPAELHDGDRLAIFPPVAGG